MGATTPSPTIVLYDIDMRPPCAPNPWKARYALNSKGVSYSKIWVDMPDITKTRCDLGQTLDYVYANDLAVFAPLSKLNEKEHAEYARFNMNVDAAFSAPVLLMVHGLPLHPDTTEKTRAEFIKRSGVASEDDLTVRGKIREELKASLHDTLGELAKLFRRDNTGSFLLGQQASYADLVVGAWLRMMHGTLPAEEWEEAKAWHEGVFGKLNDALEKYALVN
ncbi:unnamed protein product [Penicillium manginii]